MSGECRGRWRDRADNSVGMHMQPDVIDYAPARTPRRWIDWLRLAPLFAVVCAVFAWLKSGQYHDYGHLPDEQVSTLIFVILSLLCLVITFARIRRYRGAGRAKTIAMCALCAVVLIVDALALWNLHTAIGNRLF